ncbi:uncharacterized protein LOC131311926 isoform X2 [Rhododendron vialii]|uniref:uncharacterized protein LOC131311926 isoform X2 n=1 Tax=Rhododendron vialii TaxID=182163 RepID=UPI00265E92DF|nr:uncharacterized protein LOC131311926 isoform X2 [Rhododendron vialii]
MASDAQEPTRCKHRRSSPDGDAEEPSKRRKHRHHRHRHHRRHSSRKHGEEEEVQVEDERKREVEEEVGEVTLPLPLPSSNSRPNYDDMEEGEIVEEDEDLGGVRSESDNRNSEIHIAHDEYGLKSSHTVEGSLGRSFLHSKLSEEDKSDEVLVIDGSKIPKEVGLLGNASSDLCMNGDIGLESIRENYMPDTGSESPPLEGSIKVRSYYDDDIDLRVHMKSLTSENNGDRQKNVPGSPLNAKLCEEVLGRNRSKSHDEERGRSGSQSVLEKASLMKKTNQRDSPQYPDNRRSICDSDDDKMVGQNREHRHEYRDLFGDKERERSSSYGRSTTRRVDRHHSQDTWDRDREGSRETWNRDRAGRDMDRDRKREREQNRDRDRERGIGGAKHRDRDRERDRDRDRDRERDRDRDRDRERDRDRDRDREREKDREREDRERVRERRRESEKERKWHRESGRERSRDRERDKEMSTRHRIYEKHADDGFDNRDRYYDSRRRRRDETDHRDGARKNDPQKTHSAKIGTLAEHEEKSKRDKVEQDEYQERMVLQLEEQEEEEDLNRIKEESRRRRQAILEKYKCKQLNQRHEPQSEDKGTDDVEQTSQVAATVSGTPETLDDRSVGVDTCVTDLSFNVGKSPQQNGISSFERTCGAGGLGEGTPKSERSDDIFRDDIFGESPAGVRKTGKGDGLAIERSGIHDNWDDAEGYYSHRFGEILDGRYEVTAAHGKGVFSTVVRAKDLKAGPGDPEEVAIKIIRNNETMHKAGKEELIILKKLVGADPDNKRHCVRFLSSFKYRNHLCLVFESLHMNLREVLKKFGRNIGLKLTAVRTYAKQLFIALKHLRNCGVLHCDIKPDNMLVNEAKNVLKLCDFGNAMFAGKNEITPYLVSRFYRAPEIILGLSYDHPMDIWSVGCCLFELYTGKVLFPGATNNDMLRLHMELKGSFPKKMLRKGAFTEQHFDQDLNFLATEEDPVTKKTMKRLIPTIKPKDIAAVFTSSPGEDPKMLANFRDLLEKVFVLDPDKRITVSQALSHPFITELRGQLLAWWKLEEKMFGVESLETSWRSLQWNVFCFYCKTTRRRRFFFRL